MKREKSKKKGVICQFPFFPKGGLPRKDLYLGEKYGILYQSIICVRMKTVVYLDNSATTAVSPSAAEAMVKAMTTQYGNPSSLHSLGVEAECLVTEARRSVARLIGASPEQVIFTGSGTEANNLAILGGAEAKNRRPHVAITTALEHPSVAKCFDALEKQGWSVTRLQPNEDGNITPEQVEHACTPDTTVVSVMAVNNETGAKLDIPTMVSRVKRIAPQALFHTDCVQAAGKIPLFAERWGVDLLSVSGHKLHGPKGVGALYIRKGVRLLPRILGGGQENGFRSGTEPVPAIVGFGTAAAEVPAFAEQEKQYMQLRNVLIEELQALPEVRWHTPTNAVPYIVNVSLLGFRSETLVHFLAERNIFVSGGSACSKGKHSSVLTAMRLPEQEIDSFCRHNTEDDVRALAKALREAVATLQRRKINR